MLWQLVLSITSDVIFHYINSKGNVIHAVCSDNNAYYVSFYIVKCYIRGATTLKYTTITPSL